MILSPVDSRFGFIYLLIFRGISYNTLAPAIDRYLRTGGLGEQGTECFSDHLAYIVTHQLDMQQVVGLVLFNRQAIFLRPAGYHFIRPDTCIKHRMRIEYVHPDARGSPFERGHAPQLGERRF